MTATKPDTSYQDSKQSIQSFCAHFNLGEVPGIEAKSKSLCEIRNNQLKLQTIALHMP